MDNFVSFLDDYQPQEINLEYSNQSPDQSNDVDELSNISFIRQQEIPTNNHDDTEIQQEVDLSSILAALPSSLQPIPVQSDNIEDDTTAEQTFEAATDALYKELNSFLTQHKKITDFSQLPIFQYKDHLLSTVNSSIVTILSCATGSGKSTQVPQFVVNAAFLKYGFTHLSILSESRTRKLLQSNEEHHGNSQIQTADNIPPPSLGSKKSQFELESSNSNIYTSPLTHHVAWMSVPQPFIATTLFERIQKEIQVKDTIARHIAQSNNQSTDNITPTHVSTTLPPYNQPYATGVEPTNSIFITTELEIVDRVARVVAQLQSYIDTNAIDSARQVIIPFTCLILDEVHERTICLDLLLSLFLRLYDMLWVLSHPQRYFIRFIAMSATVNLAPLCQYFQLTLSKYIPYPILHHQFHHLPQHSTPPSSSLSADLHDDLTFAVNLNTKPKFSRRAAPTKLHLLQTLRVLHNSPTSMSADVQQLQQENQSSLDNQTQQPPSTTAAAQHASQYLLDDSPFPIKIQYQDEINFDYVATAARRVLDIHLSHPAGDILIFLPRGHEISVCQGIVQELLIEKMQKDHISVITPEQYQLLIEAAQASSGDSSSPNNDSIRPQLPPNLMFDYIPIAIDATSLQSPSVLQSLYSPAPNETIRKFIFSTAVAETAITIPNIVYVVDTGYTSVLVNSQHDYDNVPLICTVSQSQAQQRAGRAGRIRPGVCYRLYTNQAFQLMPRFPTPEIQRANLLPLLLLLAKYGLNYFSCRFFQQPSTSLVTQGYQILSFFELITIRLTSQQNLVHPVATRIWTEFPLAAQRLAQEQTHKIELTQLGHLFVSFLSPVLMKVNHLTPSIASDIQPTLPTLQTTLPPSIPTAPNESQNLILQLSVTQTRLFLMARCLSVQCARAILLLISYFQIIQSQSISPRDYIAAHVPVDSRSHIVTCRGCRHCLQFFISRYGDLMTVFVAYAWFTQNVIRSPTHNNGHNAHQHSISRPPMQMVDPKQHISPSSNPGGHLNFPLLHAIHARFQQFLCHPLISACLHTSIPTTSQQFNNATRNIPTKQPQQARRVFPDQKRNDFVQESASANHHIAKQPRVSRWKQTTAPNTSTESQLPPAQRSHHSPYPPPGPPPHHISEIPSRPPVPPPTAPNPSRLSHIQLESNMDSLFKKISPQLACTSHFQELIRSSQQSLNTAVSNSDAFKSANSTTVNPQQFDDLVKQTPSKALTSLPKLPLDAMSQVQYVFLMTLLAHRILLLSLPSSKMHEFRTYNAASAKVYPENVQTFAAARHFKQNSSGATTSSSTPLPFIYVSSEPETGNVQHLLAFPNEWIKFWHKQTQNASQLSFLPSLLLQQQFQNQLWKHIQHESFQDIVDWENIDTLIEQDANIAEFNARFSPWKDRVAQATRRFMNRNALSPTSFE